MIPANADVVTYTNNSVIPSGSDTFEVDFNLPQFNPALGLLQDVTFQVTYTANGTLVVRNLVSDPQVDGCNCALLFGLSNSAGDSFNTANGFVASSDPFDPLPFDQTAMIPWSVSGSSGTQPVNSIVPYIGTGQIGFDVSGGAGPDFISFNTAWSIGFDSGPIETDLTYTYAPSAAPEPTTWMATGLILGGLIWKARQKIKASGPSQKQAEVLAS